MAQGMPVETLTADEPVLADYEAQFAYETRPTYASAADYANIADDFGKTIEQTRAWWGTGMSWSNRANGTKLPQRRAGEMRM
jgi:hypothetical protein